MSRDKHLAGHALAAAVRDYFDAAPAPRRAHLQTLHTAILECFPDATVDMSYRMPTYRHGEGWVAIADQKHHVSLYTCAASHLEAFKARHPEFSTGKGCVRFRERDTIPVSAVQDVVRHAIGNPEGR